MITSSFRVPAQRYRRFNRWTVALSLGLFGAVMTINLAVDPYNVFGTTRLSNGYTDNERFNKVSRVLRSPQDFDAFVVGSSRMGLYDVQDLRTQRPARHYYNLAVFGGHARDAHVMLEALVEEGVAVREVVMGIDLFPFLEQDTERTPAYRHHPRVTGGSTLAFYKSYLFVPSLTHVALKLQQNRLPIPDIVFDFENTGRYYLRAWDRRIEQDHHGFMAEVFAHHLPKLPRRQAVWNHARFDQLAAFRQWLTAQNIPAYFYIQPHHSSELARYAEGSLAGFRNRIRAILGDVPDYSEYRDWSTNNAWYYEPTHYRPVLAAEVVKQLFAAHAVSVAAEYGQ